MTALWGMQHNITLCLHPSFCVCLETSLLSPLVCCRSSLLTLSEGLAGHEHASIVRRHDATVLELLCNLKAVSEAKTDTSRTWSTSGRRPPLPRSRPKC